MVETQMTMFASVQQQQLNHVAMPTMIMSRDFQRQGGCSGERDTARSRSDEQKLDSDADVTMVSSYGDPDDNYRDGGTQSAVWFWRWVWAN